MIVQRLPESRDPRAPYARMATVEQNFRDMLREHDVNDVTVRALWTNANEHEIALEVTDLLSLRGVVIRP